MTISVRRLSRVEMDQVAVVLRASFDERFPWLVGLHTPEEDRAFCRDHLFDTCEVHGTLVRDLLVGFMAFRDGWVEQLYVLPGEQRRGVGQALLGVAMAASPRLQLWTFQRNERARRFYEKHGFTAISTTDGSRNEEREPDVLYCWEAAG